ncbi:MAG: hypothetical protein KI793_35750 [Rivularia sp. (in: Bacteria)]|nr:hypothetical protein [Rivularia sp. MS3]
MVIFKLIKKIRIKKRRKEIAENATETLKEFKAGKAKRGNFSDLKADLLDKK